MEHKDYKLEIVIKLLNSKNHIRGIAKSLNTNHMIVFRKINELYQENVVDFKEEGKNKSYFLKRTLESKNYIISAEVYKLIKLIKRYPNLKRVIELIQKNKQIKLAILFGSYAKGIAKENSDIDVYIKTNDRGLKEKISQLDSKLSIKIGKYDKSNLLIQEIEKNHIILKGVEEFYETEFF